MYKSLMCHRKSDVLPFVWVKHGNKKVEHPAFLVAKELKNNKCVVKWENGTIAIVNSEDVREQLNRRSRIRTHRYEVVPFNKKRKATNNKKEKNAVICANSSPDDEMLGSITTKVENSVFQSEYVREELKPRHKKSSHRYEVALFTQKRQTTNDKKDKNAISCANSSPDDATLGSRATKVENPVIRHQLLGNDDKIIVIGSGTDSDGTPDSETDPDYCAGGRLSKQCRKITRKTPANKRGLAKEFGLSNKSNRNISSPSCEGSPESFETNSLNHLPLASAKHFGSNLTKRAFVTQEGIDDLQCASSLSSVGKESNIKSENLKNSEFDSNSTEQSELHLLFLEKRTTDWAKAKQEAAEEKAEAERVAKIKSEEEAITAEEIRIAVKKAEAERLSKLVAWRVEADRLAKDKAERDAAEKKAIVERLAKFKTEKETAEKKAETERSAKLEAEKESRIAKEKLISVQKIAETQMFFRLEAEKEAGMTKEKLTNAQKTEAELLVKLKAAIEHRISMEKKVEAEELAKLKAEKELAENKAETERLAKLVQNVMFQANSVIEMQQSQLRPSILQSILPPPLDVFHDNTNAASTTHSKLSSSYPSATDLFQEEESLNGFLSGSATTAKTANNNLLNSAGSYLFGMNSLQQQTQQYAHSLDLVPVNMPTHHNSQQQQQQRQQQLYPHPAQYDQHQQEQQQYICNSQNNRLFGNLDWK